MEDKWIIEIIDGNPVNYYCKGMMKDRVPFSNYIEVYKDGIDVNKLNLYSLVDNKLILDENKVREYNNQLFENKKSSIKNLLSKLKAKYSETEFEFKNQYLQKNRANGDRDNLTAVVVMMLATGQTMFKGWKLMDKDTGQWVYINLTLDEMKQLAQLMQYHVTKAMKIETDLLEKLETMTEEDINTFDFSKEYERLWKL